MACLVYSTGGKFEVLPASAQAILGEYVEDGENHGRKVYRRKPVAGQSEVLLFYWDTRDGKDLNGWWFGDQLGGGQVWSRCVDNSLLPPTKGWSCPVDGPVCKHIVCVPKMRGVEEGSSMPEADVATNKRPAEIASAGISSKRVRQAEALIFESKLGDKATKAVQKLVGEYIVSGDNHGKKVYKRKADDAGDQTVWLYFWDQRDGWESSGWWFGARVGGAQVFARAASQGSSPPEKGWRIPHDSAVKTDVSVTLKGSEEDAEMTEDDRVEKVKKLVGDLETTSDKTLEKARPLLNSSGNLLEEGVLAVHDMLQSQMEALLDAKASIERHNKAATKQGAGEDTMNAITAEEERLDDALTKVKEAAKKALDELQKLELGNAEEKDAKKIDAALANAMDVVVQAEAAADGAQNKDDAIRAHGLAKAALSTVNRCLTAAKSYAPEARKVAEGEFGALRDRCGTVEKRMATFDTASAQSALSASPGATATEKAAKEAADIKAAVAALPEINLAVEQAEEDVNEAAAAVGEQKAGHALLQLLGSEGLHIVEETQRAADKAQDSITAARTLTDNLAKTAKQLSAIHQRSLLDDIAQIRKRTAEAQKKLNPYKKARVEFDQKLKVKEETDRLNADMSALEVEVENVTKAFAAAHTEDEVTAAESSLPAMLSALSTKMRTVEAKVEIASGSSAAALLAILERAKEARVKIESLKTNSRDRRKELKAESLLHSAEAETEKAEAWLARMAKAEEPWAGNVEVVPESIALPAIDACVALAEEIEPKVKASKAFIMEKLVDVRQVPEGLLRFDTQEALIKLQGRVEKVSLSVTQLKIDTYARRTKLLLTSELIAVVGAEEKVQKVVEVGKPLDEDYLGKGPEPKGMKAACKKVLEMQGDATKECTSARGVVEAKKNDTKFGISPSFRTQLLKLASRLDTADKTLATLKEAAETAKDSKQKYDAQKKEFDNLQATVEKIELEALPLGDEVVSDEANKNMAELVYSTGDQLRQWVVVVESLATKHAHGAMRHVMKRLASDGSKLQARLIEAREIAGDRLNLALCDIFVREGKTQLHKAEDAMMKAGQAEGPFLKGIDISSASHGAKAISQCEAAAFSAKAVFDEVCTFLKAKCTESKRYSQKDSNIKVYASALSELSVKVDSMKAKLDQFEKDTAQRKFALTN